MRNNLTTINKKLSSERESHKLIRNNPSTHEFLHLAVFIGYVYTNECSRSGSGESGGCDGPTMCI